MQLKIGELAHRTGLTVRALRHYDDIGLLTPSARSDAGYRLYDSGDVARLYRIQALRRLDLSLADIRDLLDQGGASLPDLVAEQLAQLARDIQQATALQSRLQSLQQQLHEGLEPAMDDCLLALESMAAETHYFSAAELQRLKQGQVDVGARAQAERAALGVELHALLAAAVPVDSEPAQRLAQRWIASLLAEAGGDEGLLIMLYTMHWHEAGLHALTGIDRTAMRYLSHAMAHARLHLYERFCSDAEMALLRRSYVATTDEWPALIAALREQLLQGTPADSPALHPLVARWQALALAKAGGSPLLQAKLQAAFDADSGLRVGSGIDGALLAYVRQASIAFDSPTCIGTPT